MHGSVLGFFSYGALQQREVRDRDVLEIGATDLLHLIHAKGPARSLINVPTESAGTDLYQTYGRDAFDVVVSTEVLHRAYDWHFALLNHVAVLRENGVLVLTTRAPGCPYQDSPDWWRFTQEHFAEAVARLGLQLVVLMPDPEYNGVFLKVRKPEGWQPPMQDDPLAGIEAVQMYEPVKVLGLPFQPDGCGYYRFWQPYTQLQKNLGPSIVIPSPMQSRGYSPLDHEVDLFDVVVRQRAGGVVGLSEWRRWKGKTKLVYETDDHILNVDTSALPHLIDEKRLSTVRECMRLSDLITVSTEALAEEVRKYNDNVVVLPDHIHEDLLKIERPHRDNVTICWAGGSSHLQDLVRIEDPMREFLADNPDVDMHFLGMDYSPLFRRQCRFTLWHEDIWEYYKKIDGDIGIAPLVDTAFNRCRAPIKALEYAALGIPTVASDVAPYRSFIIDGETGFLVSTPEEWQKRLTDLVNDESMRTEMGAKAKERAADWTIQKGWRLWAQAYEEVASI